MSSANLWLISHTNMANANDRANNRELTQKITKLLKKHKISPQELEVEIGVPISRARNWYFRNTGISALDLLRLAKRFEFVREFVMATIEPAKV